MNTRKKIKMIYNVVVVILLLLFLGYVCSRFVHFGHSEYTDDAQVKRQVTPVNVRVPGFISRICFTEYQEVHKGDTLVVLDDSEYRLHLAQAEAALNNALSGSSVTSAGVATAQGNVHVVEAGIDEAKVNMENAARDYHRYEALLARDAVTRQQYDNARTAYESAKARYEQAARQRTASSLARNEQSKRMGQSAADIRVARAAVDLARLNLSYAVIVATCDGTMGRKDIHEGQLVQPGQKLVDIVDSREVWIIANYRESQMSHVRVGAKVDIHADAVPHTSFHGEVQSISGATGASYTMTPQDNATGNFVKVEQRVPVRIALTANRPSDVALLRAGLNVECKVKY
jgi:membrane fusion protein (multidrug efflux system)